MAREGSSDTAPSAKHYVFLLMAGTVVAVVVFVVGVLVGQDSRGGNTTDSGPSITEISMQLPPAGMGSPGSRRSQQSAGARERSRLTYVETLTGTKPREVLQPPMEASEQPNTPGHGLSENETGQPTLSSRASTGFIAGAIPGSAQTFEFVEPGLRSTMPQGFAVQVGALRSEQPAQEIATQLRAKNYPATVSLPDSNAPIPWFRVRVGPYPDRAEAERVRQRLIDEEQFDAFVTR
tara:strand:- start:291 stop:998 length:708 start_codon:yes stop_codon:yes gene_type:complete